MALNGPQLGIKDLLPQPVQSPEIVVSDISSGLPEFRSDLTEGVAFEGMQPEGPPLVLRECLKCPLQATVSEPSVYRILKPRGLGSWIRQLGRGSIEIQPGVEVARG